MPLQSYTDNGRLVGLVVRHPSQELQTWVQVLLSPCIFLQLGHTSDLKISAPVAALPGAVCFKVSAGTGWPGSVYCNWVREKV